LTIYVLLEEKKNKQINFSTKKVTQFSPVPWRLPLDHSFSKLGKALRVTSAQNNLLWRAYIFEKQRKKKKKIIPTWWMGNLYPKV